MRYSFILLAVLLFLSNTSLSAQVISDKQDVLSPEKIYIHYDKEYYIAGQTIWFKAYLLQEGKPSGASNNFYLQLINANGEIISSKKYPVKGATVKGDIQLTDSLPQGLYTIRAVTPGLLQYSSENFYTKTIYIYSPLNPVKSIQITSKPQVSLQFFPESGQMLDGVLSVVAFKAVDSLGRPAEINGILKMDDTVTVASFKTYHDGMGKIQFKPIGGKKYVAQLMIKDQPAFFPLPEVSMVGISMKLDDEKDGKVFLINRSKIEKEKFEKITLMATMSDKVVYENEIYFEKHLSVKGHLITKDLPSGILHFIILNKDGIPISERLTFVDNNEFRTEASVDIKTKNLEPRAENIINVVFPEAIQRSCSVSITALQPKFMYGTNNIITSLLLTDELKGSVYNPDWYFSQKNDSTRIGLDNLLMVNGWSRYSYRKEIKSDNTFRKYEDKYLISISGMAKESKTNEPFSGGRLSLFLESEDQVNQSFDVPVDRGGHFTFDSLLFKGNTKFFYVYKTEQGKEKQANIFLDHIPADSAVEVLSNNDVIKSLNEYDKWVIMDKTEFNSEQIAEKSKLDEIKELDPANVKAGVKLRPIDEVNESYTTGVFKSMGRSNFDNINEPENDKSLSVFDFIKRSVKQVAFEDDNFVNRRNRSLFASMTNETASKKQNSLDSAQNASGGNALAPFSKRFEELPDSRDPGKNYIVAVFLNESPSFVGILKSIRMDEVALVKYYEPGFIGAGGADGPGGAIAIYTKKNVVLPPPQLEKLDYLVFNGYSITKEFYSPDYSTPGVNQNTQDNRTTLYWSPELYTDGVNKTVQVKFYNNDRSKHLKMVFEGFDVNGKLIHVERIISD